MVFVGNASAPVTETFAQYRVASGATNVSLVSNGQPLTINGTTINRGTGEGTINFVTDNAATATFQTTQANNAFGFIGAYATWMGDRLAANNGGTIGAFGGHIVQNNRSLCQPGQNVVVDGALTGVLQTPSVVSLILDAPLATTLALDNNARTLLIESGALIVSSDVERTTPPSPARNS